MFELECLSRYIFALKCLQIKTILALKCLQSVSYYVSHKVYIIRNFLLSELFENKLCVKIYKKFHRIML